MKQLTMSLIPGELTDPLLSGEATVAGDVAFSFVPAKSVDANSRAMLDGAFDVAEMSFSTYVKARDLGSDLIGLPIFTGRGFLQPGITVSKASGIGKPEDLAGKRVAIPQFWMTSTVWHRLILEQQHGVRDDAIEWFTMSEERFMELPPSPGVSLERLPTGVNVEQALLSGSTDASMVPPRGVSKNPNPATRSPYGDVAQAQRAFYTATGIFPIMHFVVMRKSLHDELPWLAGALFAAFSEAKRIAVERNVLPPMIAGMSPDDQRRLAGDDPWAFGIEENRRALDAFLGFSRAKSWVSETLALRDCFVEG
jgi:4,5-dihydroxyphthalate decarboxylase